MRVWREMLAGAGLALASAVWAQTVAGTWQGTLPIKENPRTVVRIDEQQDGSLRGVYFYIDESPSSLPLSKVAFQPPVVDLALDYEGVAFEGKLSADGSSISGTWSSGKESYPLTLRRATPETMWKYEGVSRVPTMAANADPTFEVAMIRPSAPTATGGYRFANRTRKWEAHNATVSDLLQFAWGLKARQIEGQPGWVDMDKFDISAEPDLPGQQSVDQNRKMVRKLLAERFGLTMRLTDKVMAVYVLSAPKGVPNMVRSDPNPNNTGSIIPKEMSEGEWKVEWVAVTMPEFVNILMNFITDRQIVDHTGLTGQFNFAMTLPASVFAQPRDADETANAFIHALQAQLGLKLEPSKAPVPVLEIEHIEKPSAN